MGLIKPGLDSNWKRLIRRSMCSIKWRGRLICVHKTTFHLGKGSVQTPLIKGIIPSDSQSPKVNLVPKENTTKTLTNSKECQATPQPTPKKSVFSRL